MAAKGEKLRGWLAKAARRLRGELVEEVPKELAQCEFGCKRKECLNDEWECCERRLAFMELPRKEDGAPNPKEG